MYFLNNTQFSGASGPVQFAGADRTGIISINQFIGNKTQFVGQFLADIHRNASDCMTLHDSRIQWITEDGKPPSDGTPGMSLCAVHLLCGHFNSLHHVTCMSVHVSCMGSYLD